MIAVSLRLPSRIFSSDDLADAAEQFDACDAGGDGRIDFNEYARLLDTLGLEMSHALRRERFDAIDADRDGTIGRGEFLAWLGGVGR